MTAPSAQEYPRTLLDWAVFYLLRLHWPIFPVCSSEIGEHTHRANGVDVVCEEPGKTPLVKWGVYQRRLPTEVEVRAWWTKWPKANIGLATGKLAGVCVIDMDGDLAQQEAARRGYEMNCWVNTGRPGGKHVFCAWRRDAPRNFAKQSGIDFRGDGGFVVLPYSLHHNGNYYTWGYLPIEGQVFPPLPRWLNELKGARMSGSVDGTAGDSVTSLGDASLPIGRDALEFLSFGAPIGEQRERALRATRNLLAAGKSEAEVTDLVWKALQHSPQEQGRPPWALADVEALVADLVKSPPPPVEEIPQGPTIKLSGAKSSFSIPDIGESEKTEKRVFTFTSLESMLAEPEVDVPYLVEDILPAGGFSLIGAKAKVGKSTLARCLAFAVARGDDFLGHRTSQGPVLYLALEEKRSEVTRHFRQMGGTNEPIYVHVGIAPPKSAEGIAELAAAIEQHTPVLAIIDPAFRLVRVRDTSSYAEVTAALEPLMDLARKSGCHLCVPHHAGKQDREGGDAVLGSMAIFGSVDTLIELRRRGNDRSLLTIQRYGPDLNETVVVLDEETGLVALGDQLAQVRARRAREGVLMALKNAPADGLEEAAIKDRVDGASQVTGAALRGLVDADEVERLGAGRKGDPYRYRLAKKASLRGQSETDRENGQK